MTERGTQPLHARCLGGMESDDLRFEGTPLSDEEREACEVLIRCIRDARAEFQFFRSGEAVGGRQYAIRTVLRDFSVLHAEGTPTEAWEMYRRVEREGL